MVVHERKTGDWGGRSLGPGLKFCNPICWWRVVVVVVGLFGGRGGNELRRGGGMLPLFWPLGGHGNWVERTKLVWEGTFSAWRSMVNKVTICIIHIGVNTRLHITPFLNYRNQNKKNRQINKQRKKVLESSSSFLTLFWENERETNIMIVIMINKQNSSVKVRETRSKRKCGKKNTSGIQRWSQWTKNFSCWCILVCFNPLAPPFIVGSCCVLTKIEESFIRYFTTFILPSFWIYQFFF